MDDIVCEKIRVNQGLNIRRIRTAKQIKQESLAQKIGIAQQTMSKYENQEIVDEEVLTKCANALNVPVDLIKNMPAAEDAPIQYFNNITFNNAPLSANSPIMGMNNTQSNLTYNYSEKVILKALQNEVERLNKEITDLKNKENKA